MDSILVRTGWWHARVSDPSGHLMRVLSVHSDEHPDGAFVDITDSGASRPAHWCCEAEFADDTVDVLRLSDALTPAAPPLWFAEFRESAAQPPAVNLVAFTGHGQRPGRLVDQAYLTNLTVRTSDQLGAVRWYPATGEVDQIYVDPAWRRRGIGNALLFAAGTLGVARAWPRLWGDGQRTELGEQFRNGSSWASRAADLTHIAPAMTPSTA
jgi:GNAT superfamily N-acetyltransferase